MRATPSSHVHSFCQRQTIHRHVRSLENRDRVPAADGILDMRLTIGIRLAEILKGFGRQRCLAEVALDRICEEATACAACTVRAADNDGIESRRSDCRPCHISGYDERIDASIEREVREGIGLLGEAD